MAEASLQKPTIKSDTDITLEHTDISFESPLVPLETSVESNPYSKTHPYVLLYITDILSMTIPTLSPTHLTFCKLV